MLASGYSPIYRRTSPAELRHALRGTGPFRLRVGGAAEFVGTCGTRTTFVKDRPYLDGRGTS